MSEREREVPGLREMKTLWELFEKMEASLAEAAKILRPGEGAPAPLAAPPPDNGSEAVSAFVHRNAKAGFRNAWKAMSPRDRQLKMKYMISLRMLSPRVRLAIRKLRATKGYPAAIKAAKRAREAEA